MLRLSYSPVVIAALALAACSDAGAPLGPTTPTGASAAQETSTITIPIDFVKGKGAEVSDKDLDSALKKVNEVFVKSGIKFTRNTVSQITDCKIPRTPLDKGPNQPLSDEQKAVANAAVKLAKEQPGSAKLVVVIVEDFGRGGDTAGGVVGKTVVGSGPVLMPDPFHVEKRSLGATPFWLVLAHELAHALGLTHRVLDSDKNYAHQQRGQYTAPNLMGVVDLDRESTELTDDQIAVLKKGAEKFK